MTALVVRADALALPLPDESVDLIVTSPPYWSLRSYTDGGQHYEGQLGSEPTPQDFIDALITATREMVRVLKPSGSLFVNLGDRYMKRSLLGLPWRYAIGCTDHLGLTLRSEIVWSKRNSFIDSKAAGRVRRTHETWLHLSPSRTPYENVDALRLKAISDYQNRPQYRRAVQLFTEAGLTDAHLAAVRSVGVIDSAGGAVRSGGSWTSEAGRLASEVRFALKSYYRELCGNGTAPKGNLPGSVWEIDAAALKIPKHLPQHHSAFPLEWPTRLIRGWSSPGMTVLDPFGGSGTTAAVASALGRIGISVDLSMDYARLAQWRTTDSATRAKIRNQRAGQEELFGSVA